MPLAVWLSATRSCRSPRTRCWLGSCRVIAIKLPSSTMKLLVAPSGQPSPLALQRSLPQDQRGSQSPAPSSPPRPPSTAGLLHMSKEFEEEFLFPTGEFHFARHRAVVGMGL